MMASIRNIIYGAAMAGICFLSFLLFFAAVFTIALAPFYLTYHFIYGVIMRN